MMPDNVGEELKVSVVSHSEFQGMCATNVYCKKWIENTGLHIKQPGIARLACRKSAEHGLFHLLFKASMLDCLRM